MSVFDLKTVRAFSSFIFHIITILIRFAKKNDTNMYIRVDMVGTNHDKVLTQWRHMPMCQFRANIFLIRITSNYFWASEVFKNQSFKSQIFSSSPKKNTPNWNHGLILMLLLFFINKIQNLYQFSVEKNLKKGV